MGALIPIERHIFTLSVKGHILYTSSVFSLECWPMKRWICSCKCWKSPQCSFKSPLSAWLWDSSWCQSICTSPLISWLFSEWWNTNRAYRVKQAEKPNLVILDGGVQVGGALWRQEVQTASFNAQFLNTCCVHFSVDLLYKQSRWMEISLYIMQDILYCICSGRKMEIRIWHLKLCYWCFIITTVLMWLLLHLNSHIGSYADESESRSPS